MVPIPRLHKGRSSYKRSLQLAKALQNMKFLNYFLLLWVIFALLDTDPDSEYGFGSTDPIESRSNPDRQPCLKPSVI